MIFDDLKNEIDFFIRNLTKFSRKNYEEKNDEVVKENLALNSYIKEVLEKYFLKSNKANLQILDIGSKNWDYSKGEYEFFLIFLQIFKWTA
ncbi:MAG: hypothetical protein IJB79_07790 [Candidatus Gastranaerophilales bacterium]|nr:hypothetical protein [Candidatus Gastranaerophilales bacterium]